jgi:hypothetical protein
MDLRRRTFGPHPTAQDWRDASKAEIEQALAADVIRKNPKLYAGYDEDAVKFVRNTMGPTKWDLLLAAQALGLAPQGTYLYPDERKRGTAGRSAKRSHAEMKTESAPLAEEGPTKENLQRAAKWIRRELTKRDFSGHPSHLASKVLEEADEKFSLRSFGVEGWAKSPSIGYQYLNYGDPYDATIVVRSNPTRATVHVALGGWAVYAD